MTLPRGLVLTIALWAGTSAAAGAATVERAAWGTTPYGDQASLFLVREGAVSLAISDYGARLVSLALPGRNGRTDNVLVAPDRPDKLTGLWSVAGATMGRYANRIGGGAFTIDGQTFQLDRNQRDLTLHGGARGFHTRLWAARIIRDGVELSLLSPDGDMGFPGALGVKVRYTLKTRRGRAELGVRITARTSRATHVNFTNHALFNLDGTGADLAGQTLRVTASRYTPNGADNLPTGNLAPVGGQKFDLIRPRPLADLASGGGADVNLVLDPRRADAPAAVIEAARSGRRLTIRTTEPGLQLFVPAKLPLQGLAGPAGALSLEPQHFPDSPHHPNFPTTLLRPGQTRLWQTHYAFDFPETPRP